MLVPSVIEFWRWSVRSMAARAPRADLRHGAGCAIASQRKQRDGWRHCARRYIFVTIAAS